MGNDRKSASPLDLGRNRRQRRGALGGADGHVHGGLDVAFQAIQIKLGYLSSPSRKTMASDNKTAKADQAPKSEPAAKDKSPSGEAIAKTEAKTAAKAESGQAVAAAPSNYSRGEGQKPVTAAYKENWNAIFA